MARLTEKDWKKLTSANKFKGTFTRPTPRWKLGDRQAEATAKVWNKKIAGREAEPNA